MVTILTDISELVKVQFDLDDGSHTSGGIISVAPLIGSVDNHKTIQQNRQQLNKIMIQLPPFPVVDIRENENSISVDIWVDLSTEDEVALDLAGWIKVSVKPITTKTKVIGMSKTYTKFR